MRWIETKDGWVNPAHVASIIVRPNPSPVNPAETATLYGPDGCELGVSIDSINERTFDELIPAPPGHSLITAYVDDDGPAETTEAPIIAFAVTRDGVIPHTLDGDETYSSDYFTSPWAIKRPDGKVVQPGKGVYNDTEHFLAAAVRQYTANKEAEEYAANKEAEAKQMRIAATSSP